jgi:hypothetical protein
MLKASSCLGFVNSTYTVLSTFPAEVGGLPSFSALTHSVFLQFNKDLTNWLDTQGYSSTTASKFALKAYVQNCLQINKPFQAVCFFLKAMNYIVYFKHKHLRVRKRGVGKNVSGITSKEIKISS